jgi:toxin ParE1/3/4
MTELMKQALQALIRLPAERQDDLARYLLELADDPQQHYALDAEERAAIDEAEAQLARGERVPDETMRAFWSRHGLWMRIVYTPRALADLQAIEAYISQFNPSAATRVLAAIKKAIDSLEHLPRLGLPIDTEGRYRVPISRFPYLVFYRLTDTDIFILHISHGRRRPVDPATL